MAVVTRDVDTVGVMGIFDSVEVTCIGCRDSPSFELGLVSCCCLISFRRAFELDWSLDASIFFDGISVFDFGFSIEE